MGTALGSAAQTSLVDLVGMNFFPLYKVVGPMIFFLSLLLMVWGRLRLVVTVFLRVGIWSVGAHGFLGHVIPASSIPLQLD